MLILTALILISFVIIGIALAHAIHHDGYGSRPGPRSHHEYFDSHHRV